MTPFEQMQRDTEAQIAAMPDDSATWERAELDDLRSFVRWVRINSSERHVVAEARSFARV